MNNQGSAEEIRIILQTGSDEQFECMAPPDIRIGEIVAELYDQTGNSALDSGGGNVRAVIDLIDADNSANTKRLNPDQTLEEASLIDGAILRISLERLAGGRASPAGDSTSGRSQTQRAEEYYGRIAEEMLEKLQGNKYIHPVFGASDVNADEKYCFVIMSFRNKVLNEVYQYYVKPTLESLGFTVRRDDEIFEVSIIMQEIWSQINRAGLVIADLTYNNPNVFYELGICHAIGKKVVLLSQNAAEIPFNLRHWRSIIYESSPSGYEKLVENLKSVVENLNNF